MNADIRPPDLPEIIGGRYRVLSELGRGGMGRVLKVSHIHTGETLAMKVLIMPARGRERALERFRREARSLAQVRGDHVVRVMDADVSAELGGAPYLVTELLEGEDLGRAVQRRGRLAPSDVLPLLWQVAQGLSRVHKAGLVHRDLKPANIFLHQHDGRTVVKLLDFGLVRQSGRSEDGVEAVTAHGEILGTPLYMSPEQVHGRPDTVGAPADIWAVGMVTFYLLAGRAYWDLDDMPRGVYDIGIAPLTPPSLKESAISVAFDAWFLRSCARNPAARWVDPLMQVQELAMALGVEFDPATPVALPDAPAPVSSSDETRIVSTPPSATPGLSLPTIGTSGRQRRQVTILFYRLVHAEDSTDEMDPEEFEVNEARWHARLDQALGDLRQTSQQMGRGGRFIFFGYPVAYGGDARRAIEAAQRLIARAAELSAERRAARAGGLQIRVGIHTGVVLAGPSADMPGSAEIVGQALGVASDLEHHAEPGQVLVSDATWRLVRDQFDGEEVGAGRFRIVGSIRAGETTAGAGSKLIGRDAELAILEACLLDARGGDSQTVLVTGEVGIGKSRIVQALRMSASAHDEVHWLECQSSPYFQRTAFHPVIALLRRLIAERAGRTAASTISGSDVREFVQSLGLADEVAHGLEFLFPAAGAPDPAEAALSPQLRRERAIQGLTAVVSRLAAEKPAVLVVEDLHWADPSTIEWIDRLSMVKAGRVCMVLTARPDFSPSWTAPSQVTPLQLRRLSRAQAVQLAAQAAGHELSEKLSALVAKTTDGIPLFIEELSRLLGERPAADDSDVLSSMSVPTSLSEALGARLDRLGSARSTAELASVIGMSFNLDDLRALAGDDGSVPAKLQELVRAKIVQPLGLPPHTSYAFHHALLREAAYGSLPRPTRKRLHLAVAQTLSARPGTPPEVLAHHFEESGQAMAAAGLLLQAGQDALARSANAEARGHFSRGADILDKYRRTAAADEPPVDPALDMTLRTLHGMAWVVSKGWAAKEAAAAFTSAIDRVPTHADGDGPGAIPALWANWVYLFVSGRMADAADLGERLRLAADKSGEPGALMIANLAEGTVLFDQAHFAEGIAHLDAALALFDPIAHAPYKYMYGQDPRMYGMVFKAWALWCAGSADEAARIADEAVGYAAGLGHPNSYGFALGISGLIHQCCGHLAPLAERVTTLTELSVQQGWVQWHGLARLLGGAADVMRGAIEPGVAAMQEARAIGRMIGEVSGSTHYDCVLADGLCRAGRLDDAATLLASVRDAIVLTGERAFEADEARLEGEVARLRGDTASARRLFQVALEIARSTGAKAYEARALASLQSLGDARA